MNIDALSFKELIELRESVNGEIARREVTEKAKAAAQIREIAQQYGLNLGDIIVTSNVGRY